MQDRWAHAYEAGVIDLVELKERRHGLDVQADGIAAELAAIDRRAAARAAMQDHLSDLRAVLADLDAYTPEELNQFLRTLIGRIDCKRGESPVIRLL